MWERALPKNYIHKSLQHSYKKSFLNLCLNPRNLTLDSLLGCLSWICGHAVLLNKSLANQVVPTRLTACQLGPLNICQCLAGNNHLMGSLSGQLHATSHAFVGPSRPPHGPHTPQTKLPWQFLKLPTQVAAMSSPSQPSQPATIYVERHVPQTQHQLCLIHGLHWLKHQGKESHAPIAHATPTTWAPCLGHGHHNLNSAPILLSQRSRVVWVKQHATSPPCQSPSIPPT